MAPAPVQCSLAGGSAPACQSVSLQSNDEAEAKANQSEGKHRISIALGVTQQIHGEGVGQLYPSLRFLHHVNSLNANTAFQQALKWNFRKQLHKRGRRWLFGGEVCESEEGGKKEEEELQFVEFERLRMR